MNPSKVIRENVKVLTDLPNIGKAMVEDLHLLGIRVPEDLRGTDPVELYERLCSLTGVRHDPCVLDTFMSICDFIHGGPAKPWWEFTPLRKAQSR